MASWVLGALMGLLSVFGLFIASRAADALFAFFGWLLFLFGVVMIFALITQNVGRSPEDSEQRG